MKEKSPNESNISTDFEIDCLISLTISKNDTTFLWVDQKSAAFSSKFK